MPDFPKAKCVHPGCNKSIASKDMWRHKKTHLTGNQRIRESWLCGRPGCDYISLHKDNVQTHRWEHSAIKLRCTMVRTTPSGMVKRCKLVTVKPRSYESHMWRLHGIKWKVPRAPHADEPVLRISSIAVSEYNLEVESQLAPEGERPISQSQSSIFQGPPSVAPAMGDVGMSTVEFAYAAPALSHVSVDGEVNPTARYDSLVSDLSLHTSTPPSEYFSATLLDPLSINFASSASRAASSLTPSFLTAPRSNNVHYGKSNIDSLPSAQSSLVSVGAPYIGPLQSSSTMAMIPHSSGHFMRANGRSTWMPPTQSGYTALGSMYASPVAAMTVPSTTDNSPTQLDDWDPGLRFNSPVSASLSAPPLFPPDMTISEDWNSCFSGSTYTAFQPDPSTAQVSVSDPEHIFRQTSNSDSGTYSPVEFTCLSTSTRF
ncbi:hypothetical protein OBBRIDRAFT_451750 [Obba rivulosa]|uniref:Uncharacterized protein n=1 Tax=Obba rivulosa TaxID=1052685 RepID=A0A8E2B5K9_9APHY|nr:hypothetical protein OBBRIDRAFT_451750 [Obba rivulosa]